MTGESSRPISLQMPVRGDSVGHTLPIDLSGEPRFFRVASYLGLSGADLRGSDLRGG